MKKHISILIALAMFIIQIPVFAISGAGTAANPYLVSSVSDVLAIHNDLDGYYKLAANINMEGIYFEPIGNESESAFTGTIDGNGYTISNLNIHLPDNKFVGFVGCLEGTVKNLTVSNVDAFGYRYVGGVIGYAGKDAVVENCVTSGKVSGEYQISGLNVGGIVGYNYGTISGCDNTGSVTGDNYSGCTTGGIAGYNYYGTISGCTNNGAVTSDGSNTGGVVGYNDYGTVSGCTNNGAVTSDGSNTGGVVGYNFGGTISGCTNSGAVTGYNNTGGIVGYNYHGTVKDCYNSGSVFGHTSDSSFVGGIVGYNYYGTVKDCYNSGSVSSSGYSYNFGSISGGNSDTNCKADCMVNGVETHYISKRRITLSDYSVQSGESVMMPIELYKYDRELTWISSDNLIATVNSKGVVTGVKVGSATITATTELGISTSAIITVTSTSSNISLNKSNITLQEGYTDRIIATLTPSDAQDTITWTSNNESVATVTDGVVTAVSVGSATITATTSSGKIAYCAVTVKSPTVSVNSVTLSKSELTLMQADTAQLSASVLPSNATNKTLSWSTSDENVATVSDTGVVTAISSGIAIITATANNGMYDSCVVKVVSASGPSVVLSDANISEGGQALVKASIVKNPGISAYKFNIKYDDTVLTPAEIIPNDAFGGTFATNLDDENRDALNVLWYSDDDTDMNGELFTIAFELKDTPANNSTVVSVEYGDKDICNSNGDSQALYIDDATVTITEPIPGDVYEDGEVTVYDLTLLSRYVTGIEKLSKRQLDAGDVNNDGEVDIKDVVRVAQHIVGWSGVELMSLDDNTADIKIGTAAVDESGEAYIPVSIENNSGIAGFRFNIDYNPDEVEILEIIPNTDILPEHLQTNLGQEDENGLIVTWYQEGDMNLNGELFKIKVRYTGDTASEISIKEADNNMCNQNIDNVIGNYQNGGVFSGKCAVVENEAGVIDIYSDGVYKDKSATVILAMYKQDGSLVECKTQDITLNGEKQEITFDIADVQYGYAKTFIWDSLNGMKPIK